MKYLIIIILIGLIAVQERLHTEELRLARKEYNSLLIKKREPKVENKKNLLDEKIEHTNIILDDLQDDINLKFNKIEELSKNLLKTNSKILKKLK